MKLIEFIKRYFVKDNHRYEAHKFNGLWLPLTRSNENLVDHQAYLDSALELVDELSEYYELTSGTHILDFGCGQGRLANGLLKRKYNIGSYCGIDTNRDSITWCNRWIQRYNPKFTFIHVPAKNDRYNPLVEDLVPLPIKSSSMDVVFMNSVFSHMLTDDLRYYLQELHKTLRNNGVLYTTAFIEENVPEVEENPQNYLGKETTGPLHRVRYEKSFFLDIVEEYGFRIIDFQHQKIERTKQSVIVAEKIS